MDVNGSVSGLTGLITPGNIVIRTQKKKMTVK